MRPAQPIDFVLPWVDGSAPEWQAKRARYAPAAMTGTQANRFRDYGTLKYWFRAVARYAPWVHRIYVVTDGQRPAGLDWTHPKLSLVDHRDFIPSTYLPTFNSNTIELNLQRLPQLSARFVLFNDDLFLNQPVAPSFFFDRRGLPRYAAIFRPIMPQHDFDHILLNDLIVLNQNFDKLAVLKTHWSKFLSPTYGYKLLSNLDTWLHRGGFEGFQLMHTALPHLKATFDTVWQAAPQAMAQTCAQRFRTPIYECNQYLMKDWNICTGRFAPADPNQSYFISLNEINYNQRLFHQKKPKLICINDDEVVDFTQKCQELHQILAHKFPRKCIFEK